MSRRCWAPTSMSRTRRGVLDRVDVLRERHRCGRADDLDFRPEFARGRVGPPLLVRLADEQHGRDVDACALRAGRARSGCSRPCSARSVQRGRRCGNAQLQRPLPVVLGFPSGHPVTRRAAGGAREDDERDHAAPVQVDRHVGHTQVVTAETDADRAGPRLVVHLLEVPEPLGIGPRLRRDHWAASFAPSRGP